MTSPTQIILFKTPTEPLGWDPYHIAFAEIGYEARFVSVLKETFRIHELKGIIAAGGGDWEGVVMMSRRGAEGWVKAAKAITEDDGQSSGDNRRRDVSPSRVIRSDKPRLGELVCSRTSFSSRFVTFAGIPDWSSIPLYTVGTSARDVIINATIPPRSKPDTSDSPLSAKSVSALTPILLNIPPGDKSYKPYLVIRGDKSLDEIPSALVRAGRVVREVTVYETVEDPELGQRIDGSFESLPDKGTVWLAFFSPSSARMILPHLRRLGDMFRMNDIATAAGQPSLQVRVAAIGETTRTFLKGEGMGVDAIAEEPSAEGLVKAMNQAHER